MTIDTQRGDIRYRINPTNKLEVQRQIRPGARWTLHSIWRTEEGARFVVLELGRGRAVEETGHADINAR